MVIVLIGLVGRDVVAQLKASGALDELLECADSGEFELTGDGVIPALIKEALGVCCGLR